MDNRRVGDKKSHTGWIIVILLIIIAAGAYYFYYAFVGGPRAQYQKLVTQAESEIEAQDYTSALNDLNEAIALKPEEVKAYGLKAQVCAITGDATEAIAMYQKLIELTGDTSYQQDIDSLQVASERQTTSVQQGIDYADEYNVMTGSWDNSSLSQFIFRPYENYFKYTSGSQTIEFNGDALIVRNDDRTYTVSGDESDQTFLISFDPRSDDYIMMNGQVYQRIYE